MSLEREKIVEFLKSKGYANKKIDYEEFQKLYELYKSDISELEFATIIGLNYDKLKFMRTRGTKSLILKQTASQELIDEIIQNLINKGYTNKKITYAKLTELYSPYKNLITEKEFAKIIEINDHQYKNIQRSSNAKATILKSKIDFEGISTEVKNKYGESFVTYKEFLNIYEKYRDLVNSESKFAEIIGITNGSYQKMKSTTGKTQLFRIKAAPKEVIDEIRSNVTIKYGEIDYNQFLDMYTPYKNLMSEKEFAKILNISELTLRGMKKNKTSTIICLEEISLERKNEIIEELRNKGYSNRQILYDEFLKIYETYKNEIGERDFANLLGISDINYDTIKHKKGKKAYILKTEDIEEIKKIILNDENIQSVLDTYIDYNYFLKIYEPYSKLITESQFSEIIGIKYTDFRSTLKKENGKAKVYSLLHERERIKYLTKNSRFYTLEEINQICEDNNISLEMFFGIILNSSKLELIEDYKSTLFEKKAIYIGNTPIGKEFGDKYGNDIIKFINFLCRKCGKIYRLNEFDDDIASDSIFYIFQFKGDFFLNFSEDIALKKIKKYVAKHITYRYKSYLRNRHKLVFDERNTETLREIKQDESRNKKLIDKETNIEESAIHNITTTPKDIYEECIILFQSYYEQGFSDFECIERVSESLGVSKTELLKKIKDYAKENALISQNLKAKYYILQNQS